MFDTGFFTIKNRFFTRPFVSTNQSGFIPAAFLAGVFIFLNFFGSKCVYSQENKENSTKSYRKCWELKTPVKKLYASDNQNDLFILFDENNIRSIDAVTGKINWTYELGGRTVSNFVFSSDALFVANTAQNSGDGSEQERRKKIRLRSINLSSGIPFWASEIELSSNRLPIQNEIIEPTEKNDRIFLAIDEDDIFLLDSNGNFARAHKQKGILHKLNTFESKPKYFFDFGVDKAPRSGSSPVFAFQGLDKNIYFLAPPRQKIEDAEKVNKSANIENNEKSETAVYRLPRSETLTAAASTADKEKEFVIADDKGNISLTKLENDGKFKSVWTSKTGASVSSITPNGENILVTSYDNFVYLFNRGNGKKIWKKRLSGRVLFKPLIIEKEKEKTVVVIENDAVYLIALANGRLLNRLLLLPTGEYFISGPVAVNNQYIFQTNAGIVSFSDSDRDC